MIQPGVDVVLEVTVNTNANPPIVMETRVQTCRGGAFSSGGSIGGGWQVGLDNGIDGSDVVEAALPLYVLGPTQTILIGAGALNPEGQDDTSRAPFTFAVPLPTLGTWGLVALIAVLAIAGVFFIRWRKDTDKGGTLALLLVLGVLFMGFADNVITLDGQVGDWAGIEPLIIDASGEAGTVDATDIRALFFCPGSDRLFVRVDVADLENDAPVAVDDTALTPEDSAVTIDVLANDNDPDADHLTIVALTQPGAGTATIDAPGTMGGNQTVTYTPDLNSNGQDSFTYTVEDPAGASATATVTITVTPVNDPPTAIALDNDTILENQPAATPVGMLSTTDPDAGDSFTYALVPGAGDSDNAQFQISGDQLQTATPLDFEAGATRQIRVRATDSGNGTFEQAFTITVIDRNDPPTAIQLDPTSVPENEPAGTLVGTFTTTDQDPGQTFLYSLVNGTGDDDNASFTIDGDRLRTAAEFDYETRNEYSILVQSDDQATRATTTQVFAITIIDVREAPELDLDSGTAGTDFAAAFTEDGGPVAIVGALTIVQTFVTDIQGATVTLTNPLDGAAESLAVATGATAIAANYDTGTAVLTLTGADSAANYQAVLGTLSYDNSDQDPDESPRQVTVVLSDDLLSSNTAMSIVSVTGTNDDPTAVNDTFAVLEDSADNLLTPLVNDSDAPDSGETLTIIATGTPDNGGTVGISGGGTTLTYTPAMDFMEIETFTYRITDGNGGMATAFVAVQVENVNDSPTANADSFTVDEDTVDNNLDVLANDSILPDAGETLTVIAVGATDNGGLAVIAGGGTGIDYTPAADFAGTETFDYTISDGDLTDTNTVTVTVLNVDDPVTAVDDSLSADEDSVATTADVLANDTAPDGGLAIQSVDATSIAGAAISNNGDGTFDFDPTAVATFQALDDGESTLDSFDYVAEDVDGDTDSATVEVTVNGANDAPVADASSETTMRGAMVVITLTGSDVDVESLAFSIESGPSNGSLGAITPLTATTAQVTYTHDNGLTTSDAFTFTVNDGTADSAAATVSLTINDAPVAVDDGSAGSRFILQRDSFLDIDVAANDTDAQGNGTIDLASVVPINGTRGMTLAIGGGIVTYTANPGEIGPDTFTYTIADDMGTSSNSATVFVDINDPPVADDDMVAVSEGDLEVIPILAGDTDSDDTIDVTSVAILTDVPGGEGTTTVNPDGTVSYDPGTFTGDTGFTYTVDDTRGGTSNIATVSITVSPDPMATADSYFVYGHTTVSVPAAIGLLANDTDDGVIMASVGTFPTDMGGSITIAVDGSFSYTTPAPGAITPPVIGGTDTYTYEIEDDVMGTDSAVITFTYEKVVWFVDNTNASGTDDGSQADPFDTLAEAETVSDLNETIFVFTGDGTTTGMEDGFTLKSGQELFGEAAGLSVDVDGMGPAAPIELVAASMTKPVITDTVEDVVILDDDNEIEGLTLQPQASAGILAAGAVIPMKRDRTQPRGATRTESPRIERIRDPGAPWHASAGTVESGAKPARRPSWFDKHGEVPVTTTRTKFGGTTSITNVDIEPQNDFSDGMVFLGQEGILTVTDVTITGAAGFTGLGFDYEFGTADVTIDNLTVTDMGDSVFFADNLGNHQVRNLNIDTDDGYGLTIYDTYEIVLTGSNSVDTAGGITDGTAVDLGGVLIGAAGLTLETITSVTCYSGILLDTVSGGPFNVTGVVTVTDTESDGILVEGTSSNVTFDGPISVTLAGDDALDLSGVTGMVNFNDTLTLMMSDDDGIDIESSYTTSITFADTVAISDTGDVGVELNGHNVTVPTGTVAFNGLLDIDNSFFSGIYAFDNLGTVTFAAVDIDTVVVGGVIFDEASITAGHTFSFTQLDIDAGGGPSQVGLGFTNGVNGSVDVDAGTIENVSGETLGFINSMVDLTFSGTVTRSAAGDPLLLVDNDDASMPTFESGSLLQDTGGDGLQFEEANGTYTFEGSVSVTGNDADGIFIGNGSTGTLTFDGPVVLNTGTGRAFDIQGGTTVTVSFNSGLDIDTTTGIGFRARSGTLNLVDPASADNTIDTTGAANHLLDLNGVTVGTGQVAFTSITGSAATNNDCIDIDTLSGGTLTAGTVTLAGSAANGIDIADSSTNISFSQVTLTGAVVTGINLDTNTGSVTFADLAVDVTGVGLAAVGGGSLIIDSGDSQDASLVATSTAAALDGMTLDINLTTLTASDGSGARGLQINDCTGTFNADTTLANNTTAGIEITASTGTFTFDAIDIDVSAGTGLLLASAGTVRIDSDESALTSVNATGGPAVDIDDTLIDIHLDVTDSTDSSSHGVSLTQLPAGTTAFAGGTTTVTNPAVFGINIDGVGGGALSFGDTTISDRNGSGIFVRDHQGTSLTFGDVDIPNGNNAGGDAFHVAISGGGGSTAPIQLASLDAADTNVTVDRTDAGGDGVPDNETFDGNAIFLSDHTGGFTITGLGLQGDGGTLQDLEGDGIVILRSTDVTLNQVTIDNIGTSNQSAATVDNAGIYGIDVGGNIAVSDSTISRFQDGDTVGGNSRGIYLRNQDADFTEIRVTDTTFFNDANLWGDDAILVETFGSVSGSVVVESLFPVGNASNRSVFSSLSGMGVQILKSGGGTLTTAIVNSSFADAIDPGGFGGIELSGIGSGVMSNQVDGCSLSNLFPGGVNNGGMITLFAGGTVDYDATVNDCSLVDSDGRGGIRATTDDTPGNAVTDFDITITDNIMDDLDREPITIFAQGEAVPAASGQEMDILIQGNMIGQVTPSPTSGQEGFEIRALGDAKIVNMSIQDNTLTNLIDSTSDETIDIDAEGNATLNLTILGNTLAHTGTASEALDIETEAAGATICLDLNSANVPANANTVDQDILLTATTGTFNIEDIGGSPTALDVDTFIEARNNGTATVSGTYGSCNEN